MVKSLVSEKKLKGLAEGVCVCVCVCIENTGCRVHCEMWISVALGGPGASGELVCIVSTILQRDYSIGPKRHFSSMDIG